MGANSIPPLVIQKFSIVSFSRVLKVNANKVIKKNELFYVANVNTFFENPNMKLLKYVILILKILKYFLYICIVFNYWKIVLY